MATFFPQDPWPYWTSATAATTNGYFWQQDTSSRANQTWYYWTSTIDNTTSPVYPSHRTIQAWENWNNYPSSDYLWRPGQQRRQIEQLPSYPPPEEQARQERELARRRLIQRNRSRSHSLRKRIASRRAEQLLLECLTEDQRKEWKESRRFHVITADGERTYRIREGVAGNVELVAMKGVAASSRLARYCIHVPESLKIPVCDNVLTQKLLLESNEEEFLRIANVS